MIILGIDQSYTKTGTAVLKDDELIKSKSWNFTKLKSKTEKRKEMKRIIKGLINKYKCDMIIVERIRTFSRGQSGGSFFSMDYIKSTAALIATIVDTAQLYGIPVYSVDTRSWKAQIVGKSTHNKNESTKQPTLDYVENTLGYTVVDDNEADAICIAKYGFLPKTKQKLKKEQ